MTRGQAGERYRVHQGEGGTLEIRTGTGRVVERSAPRRGAVGECPRAHRTGVEMEMRRMNGEAVSAEGWGRSYDEEMEARRARYAGEC